MASTATTPAPTRGRALVEVVIAFAGALLGTVVTDALEGTPTLRLAGMVLGALIPALLAEILPRTRTRPAVALGVALVAVVSTYFTLTVSDYATKSSPTFPLPPLVQSMVGSPTGTITERQGGLGIEVTPASLECTEDGCAEQVRVRNSGDAPLELWAIEVQGPAAAAFAPDPDGVCAHHILERHDDECVFDVIFTPSGAGGTETALLVINQNLPGDATYVPLSGDSGHGNGGGNDGDNGGGNGGGNGGDNGNSTVNLKLSADNVECVYQRSGAVGGRDALQIFVSLQLEGTVDKLVPMTARSDSGSATEFRTAVGSGSVVAALPLRSTDYGRPHTVTVTVDPENEIPETDEYSDNRIVVHVEMPPRPTVSTVSLECSATPA